MTKLSVDDTSLVAVADAIRAKSKTTEPMTFPEGFVSAVEGISDNVLPGVVDNSISEITADMLEGCTKIREHAFQSCNSLTSIVIPNSVTSIETSAFYGCSGLTSIVIPNSVTSIGGSAFYYCSKLTSIVIPNSVTSIGSSAFYGCGLTSIVISNSVTSIENSAFQSCNSLTSIVIPNSVTSIKVRAFYGCSGLTSIVIPNSVTSIGSYAFGVCSNLVTVEIKRTTPPKLGEYAFSQSLALTQIIVPAGTLSAYQSDTNWSAYADLMVEASA